MRPGFREPGLPERRQTPPDSDRTRCARNLAKLNHRKGAKVPMRITREEERMLARPVEILSYEGDLSGQAWIRHEPLRNSETKN
jgi:hypothetical protein